MRKRISGTNTPWGESQYSKPIAKGLIWYSTAGHGGLAVSPNVAQHLSHEALQHAEKKGGYYWFEEDVDALFPMYELAEKYPNIMPPNYTKEKALESIQRYHKDYVGPQTPSALIPKTTDLMIGDIIKSTDQKIYVIIQIVGQTLLVKVVEPNGEVEPGGPSLMRKRVYEGITAQIIRKKTVIWSKDPKDFGQSSPFEAKDIQGAGRLAFDDKAAMQYLGKAIAKFIKKEDLGQKVKGVQQRKGGTRLLLQSGEETFFVAYSNGGFINIYSPRGVDPTMDNLFNKLGDKFDKKYVASNNEFERDVDMLFNTHIACNLLKTARKLEAVSKRISKP